MYLFATTIDSLFSNGKFLCYLCQNTTYREI